MRCFVAAQVQNYLNWFLRKPGKYERFMGVHLPPSIDAWGMPLETVVEDIVKFGHSDVDGEAVRTQLTGNPPLQRAVNSMLGGHPYRLFSYFYNRQLQDPSIVSVLWENSTTIMDSGLFSFMFGGEKDTMPATLDAYMEYTVQYLKDLDDWNYKGILVEADTQRLLGMPATLELRKLFREYEDRTIFVWHEPEGFDGLEKLALRYDYIALSIPELRMICGSGIVGGGSRKVPRMVNQLLMLIHDVCRRKGKKPPKVHLLGCTVPLMMQTSLAWSCDSTLWLAGSRFAKGYIWRPGFGLKMAWIRSEAFAKYKSHAIEQYPGAHEFAMQQINPGYYLDLLTSAHALGQYQRWLDTRYSPVEMR